MLTTCSAAWWSSTREVYAGDEGLEYARNMVFVGQATHALSVLALLRVATNNSLPRWQLLPVLVAFALVTPENVEQALECYRLRDFVARHGPMACFAMEPLKSWELRWLNAAVLALTALGALLLNEFPLASFPRVAAMWWKFRHVGLVTTELQLSVAQVRHLFDATWVAPYDIERGGAADRSARVLPCSARGPSNGSRLASRSRSTIQPRTRLWSARRTPTARFGGRWRGRL